MADGVPIVLRRMGHRVMEYRNPRIADGPCEFPGFDLVLVLVPEAIDSKIYASAKPPIALWICETTGREDFDFGPGYDFLTKLTPYCFFPSASDAEHYGCTFLPFGVDTEVFQPMPEIKRDVAVGFLGQLYAKRRVFLGKLEEAGIHVEVLPRVEWDSDPKVWGENLVLAYNRIDLFVSLPSLSLLTVCKVYEAMACGCVVAEMHGEEDIEGLKRIIAWGREHRDEAGMQARMSAVKYYKLEYRLQKILDTVAAGDKK